MQKLSGAKFHFVGIGGIGMCGLAELLHNLGAIVTGSDLKKNQQTDHLEQLGINVYNRHGSENLGNVDVVVYSSAVKFTNPEILEARRRHIPIIPRAEALAEIMRLKRGIAIAGTHGKTTTTSLCASAFLAAESDPTIVVGGRLDIIKSTAKLGMGEWLIAEADESDGSFQKLSPEILIITNIDDDHLDYYKTFENLQHAFYDFALKAPFYGTCIICGDDENVRKLFKDFPKRVIWYGFSKDNDYRLEKTSDGYLLFFQGKIFSKVRPPIPGDHNALNAAAALIAGSFAGYEVESLSKGIENFAGVDRRFQFKGVCNQALIYDDYGHHPTEIKAVLKAFKEKFPDKYLHIVFQPHRFSRFQVCWKDFLSSFDLADGLYVLPVYGAGEFSIDGINSEEFCKQIQHPQTRFFSDFSSLKEFCYRELGASDILLTLGAGDVWKIGAELCQ